MVQDVLIRVDLLIAWLVVCQENEFMGQSERKSAREKGKGGEI